jgi:DNA ligase-1
VFKKNEVTVRTIEILEELENADGGNHRLQILRENVNNDVLRMVMRMSFDPYTTYGVVKFKKHQVNELADDVEDDELRTFMGVLENEFATRRVSGNSAKEWIEDFFRNRSSLDRKWLERILLRNLRCGAQEKTVNKVWPGLINVFSVALAEKLDMTFSKDGKITINSVISYPVVCQPKLDGLRLITIKHNGEVTQLTRSGNDVDTLPEIKRIIANASFDNVVFDSEALGADWNESASVLMSSKRSKDTSNMRLNVFDFVDFDTWKTKGPTPPYSQRQLQCDDYVKKCNSNLILSVEAKYITNERELMDYYVDCLNRGYEGIMLKNPEAPYIFKRSEALLKMKPKATEEGVIVGWSHGHTGSKHEESFGNFNVLFMNKIITEVGSGYDDNLRNEINEKPDSYTGKIVEVEHQPPFTKDGKLRFPVFKRWRDRSDVDGALLKVYEAFRKETK